jgi:hypothetical protein
MMTYTTHIARITGPVPYLAGSGRRCNIPMGPCLLESNGDRLVDIIWGTRGQMSAALPSEEVQAAQEQGNLLVLD